MRARTTSLIPALLALLVLGACSSTDPSVIGGPCTKDADCNEGFYCTDQGVCLPQTDGDTDNDTNPDADRDPIEQVEDWEKWEEECGDIDGMPAPQPCMVYSCDPVPPPACWSCDWYADPDQNGDTCLDYNTGLYGICDSGECQTFVDGDVDVDYDYDDTDWDADWPPIDREEDDMPPQGCYEMGGFCQDYAECPMGSRQVYGDDECGYGFCCLPLGKVDCYQNSGQCAPITGSLDFCPNGMRPANTAQECDVFNEWCCEPIATNCVGEGGYGSQMDEDPTNDRCCEGLTQLSPEVPVGDECVAPPGGMGFYCSYCGNGICDPQENWCNCEDCTPPGECRIDSQCPAPSCYDAWNDAPAGDAPPPWAMCAQVQSKCDVSTGKCEQYEEYMEGFSCNYNSGMCEPVTQECTGLGEIGTFDTDYCCEGLAQVDPAEMGPNGECMYPDCYCFVCIRVGDNYCDEDNGENICNSGDCEGPQPACYSDDDCTHCEHNAEGCRQYRGSCWDGMCYEEEAEFRYGAWCDFDSGVCVSPEFDCHTEGGMCVNTYGCPGGYAIGNLECPDSAPLCCMPQQQTVCESRFDGYCSDNRRWCDGPYMPAPDGNTYGCQGTNADAVCCVPGGVVECNNNDDCGESRCYNEGDSCYQEIPICDDNQCTSDAIAMSGAVCDYQSGQCIPGNPEPSNCYEANGECTRWWTSCPEGYSDMRERFGCESIADRCCAP